MKTALTAAMFLLATVLAGPAGAEGGSRPGVTPTSRCVTPSEFYSIDERTTRAKAERILDWKGMIAPPQRGVKRGDHRLYRGCNGTWRTSKIGVIYEDGRVLAIGWVIAD